jgi:hypothetical protein
MEFLFDKRPWELKIENMKPGDRVDGATFLALLLGQDEEEVSQALDALEEGRITLDVTGLTPEAGSGQLALRLKREKELVEKGQLPEALEENDPLGMYLREVAGIPAAGDPQRLAGDFANGDTMAGERLVNVMLSQVISQAMALAGKGVLLLDLIQEGSLGLWQGIMNYTGGDFEEQARWWIGQYQAKAVFLQAVVNQVNNNVDIIILGAKISEKAIITMYSAALSIYTIYNSMITVFSTVYFPQTAKFLVVERSGKELTDFVIRPGRIQSIVAVAVVLGFAVAGRDFISVWIGDKYMNAYYVTLMLLVPVTVPLVENVCISIMDAKLKRTFRSVVLVIMAAINVVLTLIGVKYYGFWGAAAATVISLVVGHIIIMNIYYKKKFGIEVIRMFREIFRGILPAGLLAAALCIPFVIFGGSSFGWLLAEGCTFVALYIAFLFLFGMNDYEKKTAADMLLKFLHK